MNSRDTILQNIKTALKTASQLPCDPDNLDQIIRDKVSSQTPPSIDGLVEQFKQELLMVSGEFVAVTSREEAIKQIENLVKETGEKRVSIAGSGFLASLASKFPDSIKAVQPNSFSVNNKISSLAEISIAVVDVEYAVAESATLVVLFNKINSSLPHFLPDVVIALVRKNQLVANQFELFDKIDPAAARNMLLITGPSRTADIEKILILGAHGPRRLIVILIDEKN